MIIRLSQKLGKKIHSAPTKAIPLDENPLADWSAHLFTADRTQYIILTNSVSLYSVTFYGRGVSDESRLLDRALSTIREVMEDDGLGKLYHDSIAPSSATVQFSKALNRSVTGSMNDFIFAAKIFLIEAELSPHTTALMLNETPMSAIDYANPREAMQSLGEKVRQSNASHDR